MRSADLIDGWGADLTGALHRTVGRLRTQDLNVSAGAVILFRIPGRAVDAFISMPPYLQNEGMPELPAALDAAMLIISISIIMFANQTPGAPGMTLSG